MNEKEDNKLNILFIQPPHYFSSGSRIPSSFPIGICTIATITKRLGHEVDILDLWITDYNKKDVINKIEQFKKYDAIGISALSTQYRYIKFLANELKIYYPETVIVLGNALATHSADIVLKNTKIDICVRGEGEVTFTELLSNKYNNLNIIHGISFKNKNNRVVHNKDRDAIKYLDDLPFIDYEIFNIKSYLKNIHIFRDTRFSAMNFVTGRGCPYNCAFCSLTFEKYRFRSVDKVIEEISLFKDKYRIKGVSFSDKLVVFNEKRVVDLSKKLKKLNLLWNCQARVNHVNMKTLKIMKDSGCVAIGLGIESGSQKILDNMNKKITKNQSINAIKMINKTGIRPILQLMYRYPGENSTTLNETIQFFKDCNYYANNFSITTPLPESKLYLECLNKNIITDEDKYLEELDQGYYYRKKQLLILQNSQIMYF